MHEIFLVGFDLFVPIKLHTENPNNNHPVWFDRKLKNLKNALTKARVKRNTDPLFYNNIRAKYKFKLKQTYNTYILRTQRQLVSNPKLFWSFVNSKKKNNRLPSSMQFESVQAKTINDCCSLFNDFFSRVYSTQTPTQSYNNNNLIREHIPFGEIRLTPNEVLYGLLNINVKKGI